MFSKIVLNQNGETPYYVEKLIFAEPMFPILCATVVELRLQQMGDFYEKPHFTKENFKFREAVKLGLIIFAPNYQKAHHYVKSGRTVTLFRHYTVARKSTLRENRHWKIESSITLRRYRDVVI